MKCVFGDNKLKKQVICNFDLPKNTIIQLTFFPIKHN